MPAGRPLKFKSVRKLQQSIDNYFNTCDELQEPYTITGLAMALGTYRSTLVDYEDKPEFSYAIKAAKNRCANYVERGVATGKLGAGGIFLLKNHGFVDKQTIDHSIDGLDSDQLAAKLANLLK